MGNTRAAHVLFLGGSPSLRSDRPEPFNLNPAFGIIHELHRLTPIGHQGEMGTPCPHFQGLILAAFLEFPDFSAPIFYLCKSVSICGPKSVFGFKVMKPV